MVFYEYKGTIPVAKKYLIRFYLEETIWHIYYLALEACTTRSAA
jgi:hypothetical protein